MAALAWSLIIVVLVFAESRVAGQDTSFLFNRFSTADPHLHLSGDTTVTSKGRLHLTKHASNSVGHAFYGPAIRLLDPSTSAVASFSTNFSFLLKAQSEQRGEGLAFVLLGSKTSIRYASGGAFLGVYGSDGIQVTKTLAVEFDTFKNTKVGNVKIHDINANHVGLDLEVIRSKIQVDAGTVGIFLADGSTITSWIDYIASTSTIEVRLGLESAGRPVNPLLSYKVDLSSILRGSEFVWIGFSAATGYDCIQYHYIHSWGFSSWGLPRLCPPAPPLPTPWNGGPLSPPTSTPGSSRPSPPPTPWHIGPVSPLTSPPAGFPPPASPSHGGPGSPPTSTPGSPPHSPPPTPWHPGPVSPPTSPPTVPPSWHGEPVSPPTSPPGSPTPAPPSHGGPVTPPTLTPSHGGPILPPIPRPPNSSPDTNPEQWAIPVALGSALVLGLFLLFCWRKHHHRPPPPRPPPPPHSFPSSSLPYPRSPPMSPDHP